MWWTGFGINYLSYSPSHRCELLARKKVIFFFPWLVNYWARKELGWQFRLVLAGNRSFPENPRVVQKENSQGDKAVNI